MDSEEGSFYLSFLILIVNHLSEPLVIEADCSISLLVKSCVRVISSRIL